MPNILLVGNYGAKNFGDDLLMLAAKKGLKKYFPDYDITVMAPGGDVPLPAAGVRSTVKMSSFHAKKAMKKADFVVFGGGGLFNSEVPYSIFIWGKVIKMAKSLGKSVFMLGQSFAGAEGVSKALKDISFITTRDSSSYQVAQRMHLQCPVRLCSDLVFMFDKEQIPIKDLEFDDDKFVLLNLRDYVGLDPEKSKAILDLVVEFFTTETSYSIYLLPFGDGDTKFLRDLSAHYKNNGKVFQLPYDEEACFAALSKCQALISSRLHPLIVAMILGKPFLSLSYSSKVLSMLRDLNLEEWNVDLRSKWTETNLKLRIQGMEQLVDGYRPQLTDEVMSDARKKADDNFRLLSVFLEN